MEVEPPSVRPCGMGTRRPLVCAVPSLENCQAYFLLNTALMKPAGICRKGLLSGGPASSTHTVEPSALRRLARMEPAAPDPTIT